MWDRMHITANRFLQKIIIELQLNFQMLVWLMNNIISRATSKSIKWYCTWNIVEYPACAWMKLCGPCLTASHHAWIALAFATMKKIGACCCLLCCARPDPKPRTRSLNPVDSTLQHRSAGMRVQVRRACVCVLPPLSLKKTDAKNEKVMGSD